MPLDLIPLIERLTIQKLSDLDGTIIGAGRFDASEPFAWAQVQLLKEVERQYNEGQPVRIMVLKARQLGISTVTAGILFNWCFIHPQTNALIIAHEAEAAQYLFEKSVNYWNEWPFKPAFNAKHMSQRRLGWVETDSGIRIATARNVQSGRGRTYHAVHASECAFWDDPETLMVGLSQTIPDQHGTIVIRESTANGVGNWFHGEWLAAQRGESDYTPLFFPWYSHPLYQVKYPTLTRPRLDPTERELFNMGASLAHLEWRRTAIINRCHGDPEFFKQEYPSYPDEAFLTTGNNVFPLQKLKDAYDPKPAGRGFIIANGTEFRFVEDATGPLSIFKKPSSSKRWGDYIVSGDPTHTTMGDNACIQVLNRRTFEQVAVWHGHCDPMTFGRELAKLGYYYNDALVTTEIEGPGYGTVAVLKELSYPRIWHHVWADRAVGKQHNTLGWSTNYKRKLWAINTLTWLLANDNITIHDIETYQQCQGYTVLPNGELGPALRSGFDDAVMALAIATVCSMNDVRPEPYLGEERQRPQNSEMFGDPMWQFDDNDPKEPPEMRWEIS
jgi:hypothetical protein